MATIDMKRSHNLGLDTAKERAEELAKDMEQQLGIVWHWAGDNISFKAEKGVAKGVTGTVSVSTSQIRVEIDLPFLLKAMKGKIGGKVEDKLEKLTV